MIDLEENFRKWLSEKHKSSTVSKKFFFYFILFLSAQKLRYQAKAKIARKV